MKNRFSHLYFTLGCVFLCNPVISVFDILPDFIGCALIIKALSRLKYLDYRIELAVKQLWLLAGVSAVRTVLMPFYFDMDSSAVLSAVSLLGAAEAFCFIYFALSFYRGMSYLASRCDSDGVLARVDNVRFVTLAFVIVRVACTVLPELACIWELEAQSGLDYNSSLTTYAIYKYKRYAYVLCATLSAALGIYWVKESAGFVKTVHADKGFFDSVDGKCNDFTERNPLVPLYETVRARGILLLVGCVLMMNLGFDGVTVLPAWIGALLFAFTALRMGEYRLAGAEVLISSVLALTEYLPAVRAIPWLSALSLLVLTVAAVFVAGLVFRRLAASADAEVKEAQLLPLVAFVLFAVATAAATLWFSSLLHTVRVLLFVLWMFLEIKLVYAVLDSIKQRIRL